MARIFIVFSIVAAAVVVMASAALAKGNMGGTRPGWGFGDKNHVHTGPPGQSVHP